MPTFIMTDPRALAVRERLLKRPRTLFLINLAAEINASERWLQHFIAGRSVKPSKLYVDKLDEVLKKHNL